MGKMKNTGKVLAFVAVVFLVAAIWGNPADAQPRRISIGTADTGGVYYIYGGGIAKTISANIPNTQATAEVTPGAVDNVKMLQNQSIDFAFTKSDIAAEGIKGVGPFAQTGKVPVRAIAVLYPDIAHVVVVSSGINKLEGVGASEAPRGTLFHHYQVDGHGLIQKVNLIIATGQNNLAMNRAVAQIARHYIQGDQIPEPMLNRVEAGIRAFDPCLSCSTHADGTLALHITLVAPDGTILDEVIHG